MSLSPLRQQFYTRFSDRLRDSIDRAQSLAVAEIPADATRNWMEVLRGLQNDFQSEIVMNSEDLDGEASGRIRSIETEIYRVLKLLETDFLFLKSAKQPQTLRVRHQQFCDRLTAAASYSQAMLAIAAPPDDPARPSAEPDDPAESANPAESPT